MSPRTSARGPMAVVDAAVVYGASRYLRRVHADPSWPHRGQYYVGNDRDLFFEFLHDLVLYDRIVMDHTSMLESLHKFGYTDELRALIEQVNGSAELISLQRLSQLEEQGVPSVMAGVCRVVRAAPNPEQLASFKVPFAYGSLHHDFEAMSSHASERGLDPKLVPFALYIFRGLCYSDFARHTREDRAAVYTASPGRLSALKLVVAREELEQEKQARAAYDILRETLELPKAGFAFDNFGGLLTPTEVSPLTAHLFDRDPGDALAETLRLRTSASAGRARREWHERLREWPTAFAVGRSITVSIANSEIHGDVMQYIGAGDEPRSRHNGGGPMPRKRAPDRPTQEIANSWIDGDGGQEADTPADQRLKESFIGGHFRQRLKTTPTKMSMAGAHASGTIGVIALVVVLVSYFVYQMLTR